MALLVSSIGPSDPRWARILERTRHDFYHVPEYVALEARRLGGEPVAWIVEDGNDALLLPLIVRPLDPMIATADGLSDTISPYGYPCPLWTGNANDSPFARSAVPALIDALASERVCSAFVRLHPLFSTEALESDPRGQLVTHGPTVWIDLALSEEEQWRQVRSSDRNRINKAGRLGVQSVMDDDWAAFDDFLAIYRETMDHVGAKGGYYFDRSYFEDLRRILGCRLHLCIVRVDGEAAAAGLFTEYNQIVQFHLSGSRNAFRRASPARVMLNFVRQWATQRDNCVFHLGGGLGAREDSLFEFKAGFSHARAEYRTWRLVPDPDVYEALVTRWRVRAGDEAVDAGGMFFPQYRYDAFDAPEPVSEGSGP